MHIDILVLSETWFTCDSAADIPGYEGYHTYRDVRSGGGVSIFVSNKFKSSLIPDLTFISDIAELCAVNVEVSRGESINVVGYYRPPVPKYIKPFCDILNDAIFNCFGPGSLVVTLGDSNIDLLKDSSDLDYYMNTYQSLSFIPHITIPTRVTSHTSTCIDNIFSNILSDTICGVLTSDITDHFTTFICIFRKRIDCDKIVK